VEPSAPQPSSFRRLVRYGQGQSGAQAGATGNAPDTQRWRDTRQTDSRQSDDNWRDRQDRNRGAWNDRDDHPHSDRIDRSERYYFDELARMEGEGGIVARGPSSEDDRDRDERRPQRATQVGRRLASWWHREALTVREVMTTNPRTVAPEASLRDVVDIMRKEDVGAVPVVKADGRLWGIVTDRDIVIRGLADGPSIAERVAADVATTDLEVASENDYVADVISLMGREKVRRVPVVDDADHLVGIVSLADVANRADHHEDLQDALKRISGRRSFWNRIWR